MPLPNEYYEWPSDVRDLGCMRYFDVLTSCWGPRNLFVEYYRDGRVPTCTRERQLFWNCLQVKVAGDERGKVPCSIVRCRCRCRWRSLDHVAGAVPQCRSSDRARSTTQGARCLVLSADTTDRYARVEICE